MSLYLVFQHNMSNKTRTFMLWQKKKNQLALYSNVCPEKPWDLFIFFSFTPFLSSISNDQSEKANLLPVCSDLFLWTSPAGDPARSPGRATMMWSGRGTPGRQRARAIPRAPPRSVQRGKYWGVALWPGSGLCVAPERCSGSRIHCPRGVGIWRWVWWESLPGPCPRGWCCGTPETWEGAGRPSLTLTQRKRVSLPRRCGLCTEWAWRTADLSDGRKTWTRDRFPVSVPTLARSHRRRGGNLVLHRSVTRLDII